MLNEENTGRGGEVSTLIAKLDFLKTSVYLILAVTLWDSYCSHFTGEETNTQKDCCL